MARVGGQKKDSRRILSQHGYLSHAYRHVCRASLATCVRPTCHVFPVLFWFLATRMATHSHPHHPFCFDLMCSHFSIGAEKPWCPGLSLFSWLIPDITVSWDLTDSTSPGAATIRPHFLQTIMVQPSRLPNTPPRPSESGPPPSWGTPIQGEPWRGWVGKRRTADVS